MIEYIRLDVLGTLSHPIRPSWARLPKSIKCKSLNFNKFGFRINGVEYTENNKAFREEFEKARIWEML